MASEFCPSCGTPRTGSFRFCRKCQFDFDSTEQLASSTPAQPVAPSVSPPAPPAHQLQTPPQAGPSQMAASGRALDIASVVVAGAGALILLGAFLPWITVT